MALPAYQAPNALNFEPIQQGFNAISQNALARNQQAMEQQRLGMEQATTDLRQQAAKREQTAFDQDQQKQLAVQTGNLFESHIAPEQDPQKRAAMVSAFVTSHPNISASLVKHGIDPNDTEGVINGVMADYAQYKDPGAAAMEKAKISSLEAEAVKNKAEGAYYGNKANWPGAQNAPAGYRYSQTAPGQLEAIPGGPAAKLPSETAARIGMMRASMTDLPEVRDIFLGKVDPKTGKRGDAAASGVGGALGYAFTYGDVGQGKRLIRGGIESLLRAASGAAVPETEVDRYEQLFMPKPTDAVETRARKLDSFERWMSQIQTAVESGRPTDLNEAQKLAAGIEAGRGANLPDPLGIR